MTICFSCVLYAETPKPNVDDPVSYIIANLVTNERYNEALIIADSINYLYPSSPYGPLLTATILNFRAIDFEDDLDDQTILALCKEVEVRTNNLIDSGDSTAALWLYLGTIESYRLLISNRQGFFYRTLKYIRYSRKHFQTVIKIDSTCWDAYYGLGIYMYYLSSRAGFLRSIGLITDKRDEGIRYIKTAAEKGSLTALAARNSLMWIAVEQENYIKAERLARELLDQFPNRRCFLWGLGRILKHKKQWQEAIDVYSTLLASVRSEQRNNHYNEIGCLHSIVRANIELKNWSDVINFTNEALAIPLSEEVVKRKKADIRKLKQMRKKALKQKH